MLKIRLQRTGRTNSPSYRVIVAEHTRGPKAGNIVEVVGTYNPRSKVRALKDERIKYWMSVGAKPSDTMHNMLVSAGVIDGKKINVLPKFVAPAVAESSGEAKPEAPAAETVAETPSAPEAATPANESASEATPESSEDAASTETENKAAETNE